jgi:hypothetical protein
MHKQTLRLSIAALTFGVALASVPALAQQAGKNPNDGGPVVAQQPAPKALYNSAASSQTPSAAPHYSKGVNDGGIVDEPTPAQAAAAAKTQAKTAQQLAPQHYGKALNDGGM